MRLNRFEIRFHSQRVIEISDLQFLVLHLLAKFGGRVSIDFEFMTEKEKIESEEVLDGITFIRRQFLVFEHIEDTLERRKDLESEILREEKYK